MMDFYGNTFDLPKAPDIPTLREVCIDYIVKRKLKLTLSDYQRLSEDVLQEVTHHWIEENALTDRLAVRCFTRQRTYLDLSGATSLKQSIFSEIPRLCPHLREIRLEWCKQVGNNIVRHILRCCRLLQVLLLTGCQRVSDSAFVSQPFDVTYGVMGLKEVGLSYCPQITNETLYVLIKKCPHLQVLHMARNNHITDAPIRDLLVSCKPLKFLNVDYCSKVTLQGLSPSSSVCLCCPDQAESKLTNKSIEPPNHSVTYPTTDIYLEELHCGGLTLQRTIFFQCSSVFRHLKLLDLRWCLGVTDAMLKPLYSDMLQCQTPSSSFLLQSLCLRGCSEITSQSLLLIKKCPNLVRLDLSWCVKLECNDIFSALKNHEALEYLNISFSSRQRNLCANESRNNGVISFAGSTRATRRHSQTPLDSLLLSSTIMDPPSLSSTREGGLRVPQGSRAFYDDSGQALHEKQGISHLLDQGESHVAGPFLDESVLKLSHMKAPCVELECPPIGFPKSSPTVQDAVFSAPFISPKQNMSSISQINWWKAYVEHSSGPSSTPNLLTHEQRLVSCGEAQDVQHKPSRVHDTLHGEQSQNDSSGATNVIHPMIFFLCNTSSCLQKLKCDGIDHFLCEETLESLTHCSALKSLSVRLPLNPASNGQDTCSDSPASTSIEWSTFISAISIPRVKRLASQVPLEKLRLDFSTWTPPQQNFFIARCLPRFHRLKKLALKLTPRRITENQNLQYDEFMDHLLQDIFTLQPRQYRKSLQTLQLFNCSSIQCSLRKALDHNIIGNQSLLSVGLQHVTSFFISDCLDIDDTGLLWLCSAMSNAKKVYFLNCPRLTSVSFAHVLNYCKSVETVHIVGGCFKKRLDKKSAI